MPLSILLIPRLVGGRLIKRKKKKSRFGLCHVTITRPPYGERCIVGQYREHTHTHTDLLASSEPLTSHPLSGGLSYSFNLLIDFVTIIYSHYEIELESTTRRKQSLLLPTNLHDDLSLRYDLVCPDDPLWS